MKGGEVFIVALVVLLSSCKQSNSNAEPWSKEALEVRANQHIDSSQWDKEMYQQDLDVYAQFNEVLNSYPLNKSPFPVAKYDYAVSSLPFTIESEKGNFKGVRIGEVVNENSEDVKVRLTLMVLTKDQNATENTVVESRNYPYLTAQGIITCYENTFDWVFSASPEDYAHLLVNMKLFDLRFGETIIIYPQENNAFYYDQIKDSPNNYDDFEMFKKKVLEQLK
ncbi:hypothetical protein [Brumimicrobium aurantiacum]|uniref:Uncharacterized protein n=1 Tax=Brumimicrobium aurantiacum TaxID=1737063 RepID=A0A3E1F140_9FLAO|nr:hypothetical protein [Brumimicrobium aurantiacum]RFC55534.1 hypothetical protein DXU93_00960 [Brumimicrobium aurantiacum]